MDPHDDTLTGLNCVGSGVATCAASARSTLVNRNVTVAGHRTSIRLEPAMWEALGMVCQRENKTMNELVTTIARNRNQSTLTAAIRVFLLTYFQAAATDEGHLRAGHGLVRTSVRA
ncbi:MAG: ribbon-helix-helix domain-containing protein [Alphaproteobacteria bacterium]|nr:ribbon-helix-helix domain-containing protein [Alphaproteobacteria bacterium]